MYGFAAFVVMLGLANAMTLPAEAAPIDGGGCGGATPTPTITPTPTPEPTVTPTPTPQAVQPTSSSKPNMVVSSAPMTCSASLKARKAVVPARVWNEIKATGDYHTKKITAMHSIYATQPGTYYYSPIGGFLSVAQDCTLDGKFQLEVTTFKPSTGQACAKNSFLASALWGSYYQDYSGLCG